LLEMVQATASIFGRDMRPLRLLRWGFGDGSNHPCRAAFGRRNLPSCPAGAIRAMCHAVRAAPLSASMLSAHPARVPAVCVGPSREGSTADHAVDQWKDNASRPATKLPESATSRIIVIGGDAHACC